MFLTKLELPFTGRTNDVYAQHRVVASLAPGRNLFRHERHARACVQLLVVTQQEPLFDSVKASVGIDSFTAQSKPYAPPVALGSVLRFTLRANPTMNSRPSRDGKISKIPLLEDGAKENWLIRQGIEKGFGIVSLLPMVNNPVVMGHSDGLITMNTVDFSGTLQVTDTEKFRDALYNGIGRSKAFGCGLLTVAKA